MENVNSLVLGGGGVKGITILGALHYLYTQTNYLCNIQHYSGTSIGSVICILLASGYTPIEIFAKLHSFENILEGDINSIIRFHERYGIASSGSFIDLIMDLVHEKYPNAWTFDDLFSVTQKHVYVCAVNLSTEESCYFSHEMHGEMSLHLALRMSCNLPGIFTKIVYNDHIYVDGGLIDDLPTRPIDFPQNTILAIRLNRDPAQKASDIGFMEYFYRVASIGARHHHKTLIDSTKTKMHLITLKNSDCNVVGLHMTLGERRALLEQGYSQMFAIDLDTTLKSPDGWGDY